MKKEIQGKRGLPKKWDKEADVVVIGYGGAGAVTAITAFDAGAKVIVLEKTPSLASLGITNGDNDAVRISGGGGNTHIAMGIISSPSNAKEAADYLYAACGGLTPMDVCIAWAEEMCQNYSWFEKMGIEGKLSKRGHTEYSNLPGAAAMNIFHVPGWGWEL